jgi:hypothetical protein
MKVCIISNKSGDLTMNDGKSKRDVNFHGTGMYVENYTDNVRSFDKVLLLCASLGLSFSLYVTVVSVSTLVLQGNFTGFIGRLITLALLFTFSGFIGLIAMKKRANSFYMAISSLFSYMYLAITCFTYLVVSWNVVYNYLPVLSDSRLRALTIPSESIGSYEFSGIAATFSNPYMSYIVLLAAEIIATVFLGATSKVSLKIIGAAMIPFSLLNIMFIVHKYALELSRIVPAQFTREIILFAGMVFVIGMIRAMGHDDSEREINRT